MLCADENNIDSDAAKTLQAETWLSCTEHLTYALPRQWFWERLAKLRHCLKYSLGFSFPDGETIALSSSCHVQDDIFLSETPPVTKRQCQALGMSLVHEVEMETTAFCCGDSSQQLSHLKTFP